MHILVFQKYNLKSPLAPLLYFFIIIQESNDPSKNDEIEKVADDTFEGLREMGAFGLQVINFINLVIVLFFLFFTVSILDLLYVEAYMWC